MAVLRINNLNVHVQQLNPTASQAIIMIHGMFANMSVFYFKIAPRLAERYRVILYDLKSHGMSDQIDHGYDFATMSDDLIALMEALDLEKVHLVGYSFGALIALYTAIHFPDKVNKLGIIEAPSANDKKPVELIEQYSREYLEQYIENLSKSTNLKPSQRQIDKNHRLFEYLFQKSTIKEDMSLHKDIFEEQFIEKVVHPTLLLYGDQSDCFSAGEFLKRHITSSQLFVGSGDHNLPVQDGEWVAEKLNNFF